jgi:sterol desaturase/sphingolipid hydroxylase (fatty acid hydroxylase superfamily)
MDSVFHSLQLAISPAVLISACGLLLLSMTNRLGRVVDRARLLARDSSATREFQLGITLKRAFWLRSAILFTAISIVLTLLLVLLLFVWSALKLDLAIPISALFILSVVALFVSLAFFIRDIFGSLKAMEAEVRHSLSQ